MAGGTIGMRKKNPPPNKSRFLIKTFPDANDLEKQYQVYVKACEKLEDMRHADSKATKQEIDLQLFRTESLLQEWINSTYRFKVALN